jgi:hypothetical protein
MTGDISQHTLNMINIFIYTEAYILYLEKLEQTNLRGFINV